MQTIILVIHLVIATSLVGVILIQRSEGGALGGLGGGTMGGVMTTRGTANLLTRTTAILAGCFVATSMLLAIMASHNKGGGSILDAVPGTSAPAATTAPAATPAPAEPAPPPAPATPAEPSAPIAN
jgi:preprotein translocase subunit SecG